MSKTLNDLTETHDDGTYAECPGLFRSHLIQYLGIEDHPKRHLVFDVAWDLSGGHFMDTIITAEKLLKLLD